MVVTLQIFLAISLALPCSMDNDITPSIKNELQFQGMCVCRDCSLYKYMFTYEVYMQVPFLKMDLNVCLLQRINVMCSAI